MCVTDYGAAPISGGIGEECVNGRPWSEEATAILHRMAGHYTDEEIAGQTGHARETVTRRRLALGLPACHRIDWTLRSWPRADRVAA